MMAEVSERIAKRPLNDLILSSIRYLQFHSFLCGCDKSVYVGERVGENGREWV